MFRHVEMVWKGFRLGLSGGIFDRMVDVESSFLEDSCDSVPDSGRIDDGG